MNLSVSAESALKLAGFNMGFLVYILIPNSREVFTVFEKICNI